MNLRKVAGVSVGALAVMVLAGLAQPDKATQPAGSKPAAQPAGQPSEAEYMAAMEKAGAPGPEHARIMTLAGTWHGKCSFQMAPDAPMQTSMGTMVNTPVLGGRQLRQEWKGDMMGMPFEGLGYWGYDNIKKEYVATWTDSMSTSIMVSTGTYDDKTHTYSMKGTSPDPITGKDTVLREVITIKSPTSHTMVMYGPGPDGKEMKMMTIEYTRGPAEPADAAGDDATQGR
ncbi:MAG: DUF1579 domain-containing protein [Phycisphaerales bacterium]|nr:DUF1579 domain-containing protein [Phycisphaerales bacterium]